MKFKGQFKAFSQNVIGTGTGTEEWSSQYYSYRDHDVRGRGIAIVEGDHPITPVKFEDQTLLLTPTSRVPLRLGNVTLFMVETQTI